MENRILLMCVHGDLCICQSAVDTENSILCKMLGGDGGGAASNLLLRSPVIIFSLQEGAA